MLRQRLTHAITMGLALAGCSDRAISDTSGTADDDTSTGDATTTSTSPTTTVSGTTVMSEGGPSDDGEVDDTSDEMPRFDLGISLDMLVEPDRCDIPPPPLLGSACEVGPTEGSVMWVTNCVPVQPDGACLPETDDEILEAMVECTSDQDPCNNLGEPCDAPIVVGEDCCYWAPFEVSFCPGRPFLVDGKERIAALTRRDDWCAPFTAAPIDDALAQAWLFDARNEHAAIASFARFAMQLLALAAPPRFIDAALQAAGDEREHASLFFGLARAHGGLAQGPGALDITGALAGSDDPIHVVVATVREGCIAETISAMQLQRACETAADPELRAALTRVLEQELRHVELAWSFVAWACARGDARLRDAVREAFADAARWIPRGADIDPIDADRWRRAGRLTPADAHAVALQTLRTIVGPTAHELLARLAYSFGASSQTHWHASGRASASQCTNSLMGSEPTQALMTSVPPSTDLT